MRVCIRIKCSADRIRCAADTKPLLPCILYP